MTPSSYIFSSRSLNAAIALYSLPGESNVYACIQLLDKPKVEKPEEEFWLHPYHGGPQAPFIRICPDQVLKFDFDEFNELVKKQSHIDFWPITNTDKLQAASKEAYTSSIKQLKSKFSAGKIEKVVLSRTVEEKLPENFNPFLYFVSLRKAYPNAFISFTSTPFSGSWIGATPEILLQKRANNITTISLAGTRVDEEGTGWTEKEYHEQSLVTEYLKKMWEQLPVDKLSIDGPYEHKIGQLVHLRTTFRAELRDNTSDAELRDLVLQIHPTPAVGAVPKSASPEIIEQNEVHNRYYYSGFLGPVTRDKNASLFVNLRCMALSEKTGYVFTGAGITSGSDPEAEWQETENKANILLKVLTSGH